MIFERKSMTLWSTQVTSPASDICRSLLYRSQLAEVFLIGSKEKYILNLLRLGSLFRIISEPVMHTSTRFDMDRYWESWIFTRLWQTSTKLPKEDPSLWFASKNHQTFVIGTLLQIGSTRMVITAKNGEGSFDIYGRWKNWKPFTINSLTVVYAWIFVWKEH